MRQQPGLDDEHGRGLLIVETLSAESGVYRPEGASGKIVWSVIERPA